MIGEPPFKNPFELESDRMRQLNKSKAKTEPNTFLGTIVAGLFTLLFGTAFFMGIIIPLVFYHVFANGFVAKVLWNWFVSPHFHLAPLSFVQACGIVLLVRLMATAAKYEKTDTSDKTEVASGIIYTMLAPWGVLLLGYVMHHFL